MRMITLVLAAGPLLSAALPAPIEWERTPAAFGGRKAIVKLDTGARIEGNWLGVTPTTFTMDVERTKGKNRPSKGMQTIERSAIVELRLQERRNRGRMIGGIIGFYFGGPIAYQASSGWFLPIWAAATAGGILVGRVMDKATRIVHIKPESPQELPPEQKKVSESQALPEPLAPVEGLGGMSHETCDAVVVGAAAAARRAAIAD